MNKYKICAVLVTYNRLEDLQKALDCYVQQTRTPEYLLVIDNASNDGTKEFLDNWNKMHPTPFRKIIIHNDTNLGGAGGFSLGIKKALDIECDFIFLADDDAFPYNDMFEKILTFYERYKNKYEIAALCTAVIDQYGYSIVQRGRVGKGICSIRRVGVKKKEYKKSYIDIDLLTFVGAFIKKETILEIGLPLSEYFIHEDDAEYSTRIKQKGKILCVTSSKIYHLMGTPTSKNWIEYYTTRNYIDYIKRHFPKRYFYYSILDKYIKKCSIVAALTKHRSREFRIMNKVAILDGISGNLGINKVYKPGIKIK